MNRSFLQVGNFRCEIWPSTNGPGQNVSMGNKKNVIVLRTPVHLVLAIFYGSGRAQSDFR